MLDVAGVAVIVEAGGEAGQEVELPCPITRGRSPFAFGIATVRNATPCLRSARVVIAANAIVGLLADSALVAHKWPLPGGVIKRQTQEWQLTVFLAQCAP